MLFRRFYIFFMIFLPITALCQKTGNYVRDEVLIKFKPGVRAESMQKFAESNRLKIAETLGDLGWRRLKIPAGMTVEQALKKLRLDENVVEVQPNFYYHLLATPNDPQFPTFMYGMTKISAPQAWDIATGSSAVVVADIDTGMRYDHEDLAANAWINPGEIAGNGLDDDGNGFVDDVFGYDFRFNDPDPADENGHGTHTAGTIGAVGNNGLGVVGVNWNVKIMPIKIYSPAGTDTTSAMLINAYNYVRMMKNRGVNIRVTNNSYGGCSETCGFDQATKDAIDAMGEADILNVFAAGNAADNGNSDNDVTPFYPSSYTSPSILAVTASDSNDNRFFRYGLKSVDLAAPGIAIMSTWPSDSQKYRALSGTSMATPHAAGAAALLSSLNPSLSAISLKATLMNNVDALPQWNGFVKTGGRLNVFKALQNQTVCSFNLENTSFNVPMKGGLFKLNVAAPPYCDFSARSNANWAAVLDSGDYSGSGQVKIWVRTSPVQSRTATVRVAGQTVTIKQARPGIS
jgi:subtilisin family serine protease